MNKQSSGLVDIPLVRPGRIQVPWIVVPQGAETKKTLAMALRINGISTHSYYLAWGEAEEV